MERLIKRCAWQPSLVVFFGMIIWSIPGKLQATQSCFQCTPENQSDAQLPAKFDRILIAGPENFNPSLQPPPPKPVPTPTPTPTPAPAPVSTPTPTTESPAKPEETASKTGAGALVLKKLRTDFREEYDNVGRDNRFVTETAEFQIHNGDTLRFITGWSSFRAKTIEPITNIPAKVEWEHKIGASKLLLGMGVDFFDRLSPSPNFDLQITTPLSPSLTFVGTVQQGLYKTNAATLEEKISAWRLSPALYWQIDPKTSLFSMFRFGSYSDGNTEYQSFTRLERKFGQFSLAANLFTWQFSENGFTPYFAPSDFLVYSGELAWEGDVTDFLRCRLSASLGRQRLEGKTSGANTYQGNCTVKLSPNAEAIFGYSYSGVTQQNTNGNPYNNQTFTGQVRFSF